MSTNKAFLTGHVGKDPDVRTLESGSRVAKFSLATTDKNKDKTTQWHNITVWDKVADIAEKYVKKGSQITVIGSIQYGSYTNKEGVVKYTTDIIAYEIDLLDKKGDNPKNQEGEWQKGEKREVKSTSNADELPGYIDSDAPDDEQPF